MNKTLKVLGFSLFAAFACAAAASADPVFETPALITSAGQSIEASTAAFHFEKDKINAQLDAVARTDKLEGIKTLVVIPGHSLKGLGSAGIDEVSELERVKTLTAAAHEKNIPILCIHIGGKARRGVNSQPFIEAALQYASCCIVYDAGNEDGFFTDYCKEHNITLITIPKAALLAKTLVPLFPGK
jgi:hypothetical protein